MAHPVPPPPQAPPSATSMPMAGPNVGGPASTSNSPQVNQVQNGRNLSWEGDRMLHIYMLDYARKRNFHAVVNALSTTTVTPTDVQAPIDAPQGLLYEWWVVFWEIFTAKSSEGANPDARLYLKAQLNQRQEQMRSAVFDAKPGLQGPYNRLFMSGANSTMMGMNGGPTYPQPPNNYPLGPGPQPQQPGGPTQSHPQNHLQPNGMMPPPMHPQGHPTQQHGAPPPPGPQPTGPQPYPPQDRNLAHPHTPHNSQQSTPMNHPNNSVGQPGGPSPVHGNAGPLGQQPTRNNSTGGPGMSPAIVGNRQVSGHMQPAQQARGPGQPSGMQQPSGATTPHQPSSFMGSPLVGQGHPGANGAGNRPSPPGAMGPPQHIPNHLGNQGQAPPNAPNPTNGMNGVPPNHTPIMTPQQYQPNGVPTGRRSATPGSQNGGQVGMSPSRQGTANGPMGGMTRPGLGGPVNAPPGNQMGQPGGFSPGQGIQPGSGQPHQIPRGLLESIGLGNKDPSTYNDEDRFRYNQMLRKISQPGGTPRMAPGYPGMPPPGQAGAPMGSQGGQPPFAQGSLGPHTLGKRAGSPLAAEQTVDGSPPDSKRQRRDSQMGGGMTPTSTAPLTGLPGSNSRPMPNGNPNMNMGPPPGSMSQPQGTPTGLGMHQQGPGAGGNQALNQQAHIRQQHQHMQNPQSRMIMHGAKPPGIIQNPHVPSGLPIVVPTGGGAEAAKSELMQSVGAGTPQTILGPAGRGPTPKVNPSPSLGPAKVPSSMAPPVLTPKVKEEANPLGALSGDANLKASLANKAIPPSATISSTPVPASSTPAPNMPGPASSFTLSPGSILAATAGQVTTPNNISRPGSSAVGPNNPLNLGVNFSTSDSLGRFSDLSASLYDFGAMGITSSMGLDNSMSLINDYETGRTMKDEPLTLHEQFDIMSWVNDPDPPPPALNGS